jgi:F-type H+-transporting ATPase subunit delta
MSQKIISEISRNYAKALMETAMENNCVDIYLDQLHDILTVFDASNDLNVVVKNSSISAIKKIEIIDSIFKNKIDEKLLNFLKILIEKNRFEELNSIIEEFKTMSEKKANKKSVEIVSPIPLNFENKSNVLFKLEHKLNCEISPIWTVDKSIIAGLVYKFDDCVIDTSVKAKLEDLRKRINR